jgi:hypothetical protein
MWSTGKKWGYTFPSGYCTNFYQITSLSGRTTTNATLKELNIKLKDKSEEEAGQLDNIEFFSDENLYVVFQKDQLKANTQLASKRL